MGNRPGKNPVQIGWVTFNTGVECPSDLPIGAVEQRTAVTEYIGGGKVTQSMGAQAQQVSWKGAFEAPLVASRVKALRTMLVSGQEYALSFMDEQYFCKIIKFTPNYKNANLCPYEITVEVTRDANGALSSGSATTIDQQMAALGSDAQVKYSAILASDPTVSVVQPSIASMQQSISNAGPIAQTTGTSAATILSSITAAITSVQTYIATIKQASTQYPYAAQLLNILTLMQRNVQRGQNPKSIRVLGGNLFEVASTQYGDVNLAFALAQANGLQTPVLPSSAQKDIALPPYASQ